MYRSRGLAVAVVLAVAFATGCSDTDSDRDEFIRSGDRLFEQQDYAGAAVEYRNAVQADDRSGEARYKLGQSYLRGGAVDRARAELVRAADLLPNDLQAQIAAAQVLLRFGQHQDARARAEAALKLDAKNVEAHLLRGGAYAAANEFEEAVKAFEDGLVADPTRRELYVNIGALRTTLGSPVEAEASFKQAVAVAPESIDARIGLGNFYWSANRLPEAERTYQEAIKLNDSTVANRALATFYMGTNRAREAEPFLRKAVESTGDPRAGVVLADYYISQKQYAEATPFLDKLAATPGGYAAAGIRRALIKDQQGDRAAAYALLDDILQKEPNNSGALVVKGRWLLDERQTDAALQAALAATKAEPSAWAAHILAGAAYASTGATDQAIAAYSEAVRVYPRAFDALIALSELSLVGNRAEDAVRYAQDARRLRPGNGVAQYAVVRALVAQGEYARAEAEVQPLSQSMGNTAPVQVLLGQIAAAKGDDAVARRAFERAVALDRSSVEAVNGLVRLDAKAKQTSKAVERATNLASAAPNNASALFVAARAHLANNDFARAEAVLKQAVATDSSHIPSYYLLAEVYGRQRKLGEAQREYERLVQQRPNDVSAHTMVGILLEAQGRPAEARKAYERVIDLDARAAIAANNLAYIYAESGENLDIALNLAQTAKVGRPSDPDVDDTLGWIYYKRDLPNLARGPLEASVKQNPKHPLYQYHLGLVYAKLGETGRARAALEQVLVLQPNFEKAADVRKALAELRD